MRIRVVGMRCSIAKIRKDEAVHFSPNMRAHEYIRGTFSPLNDSGQSNPQYPVSLGRTTGAPTRPPGGSPSGTAVQA